MQYLWPMSLTLTSVALILDGAGGWNWIGRGRAEGGTGGSRCTLYWAMQPHTVHWQICQRKSEETLHPPCTLSVEEGTKGLPGSPWMSLLLGYPSASGKGT